MEGLIKFLDQYALIALIISAAGIIYKSGFTFYSVSYPSTST